MTLWIIASVLLLQILFKELKYMHSISDFICLFLIVLIYLLFYHFFSIFHSTSGKAFHIFSLHHKYFIFQTVLISQPLLRLQKVILILLLLLFFVKPLDHVLVLILQSIKTDAI